MRWADAGRRRPGADRLPRRRRRHRPGTSRRRVTALHAVDPELSLRPRRDGRRAVRIARRRRPPDRPARAGDPRPVVCPVPRRRDRRVVEDLRGRPLPDRRGRRCTARCRRPHRGSGGRAGAGRRPSSRGRSRRERGHRRRRDRCRRRRTGGCQRRSQHGAGPRRSPRRSTHRPSDARRPPVGRMGRSGCAPACGSCARRGSGGRDGRGDTHRSRRRRGARDDPHGYRLRRGRRAGGAVGSRAGHADVDHDHAANSRDSAAPSTS